MIRQFASLLGVAIFCLTLPVTAQQVEPRPLFVEGYTDQLSYVPGEEVAFHLSTSAANISMTIERIGASNETVWEKKDVAGSEHTVPANASSHGCNWPETFRLAIPTDWRTGYYQARLQVEDRGGEFIQRNTRTATSSLFFVVRSAQPGTNSKILLQLSTNTYNAYTNIRESSLVAAVRPR